LSFVATARDVRAGRPHLGFGIERVGCRFPVRDFRQELARGSVVYGVMS